MNLIFLRTAIRKLYGVLIDDLLYDSDIHNNIHNDIHIGIRTESTLSSDSSSYSDLSEDDSYILFLKKKNDLQAALIMKNRLCFVVMDESDTCYVLYYPGTVTAETNHCLGACLCQLARGIEIVAQRYDVVDAFAYLRFPEGFLLEFGTTDWIMRLDNERVLFNEKTLIERCRSSLSCYSVLPKSAYLKRTLVFNCNCN